MTRHIKLSLLALVVCTVTTNLLIAFPTIASSLPQLQLASAAAPRLATLR